MKTEFLPTARIITLPYSACPTYTILINYPLDLAIKPELHNCSESLERCGPFESSWLLIIVSLYFWKNQNVIQRIYVLFVLSLLLS